MSKTPQILVLGTADWDQPIATNQHYVVRELCREGFADVTFVESMALRRPQLSARDARRIWARLKRVFSRQAQGPSEGWRARPPGLTVKSPLSLPWHRGAAKYVNRRLLGRLVSDWTRGGGPRVLWTYTPVTYGLEQFADVVVYHCVDLLGEVPGIDQRVIAAGEADLAQAGVISIATSEIVRDHLIRCGHVGPLLWENVADTEVIEAAAPSDSIRDLNAVIFAGNLSPSKIDYALLSELAESGLDVRIAGPRAEGGGNDDAQFSELIASGVHYLGMLTLPELATHLARARVGVIPYVINDYTAGVSPLKTFEYLAAGLPVVATALPGVRPTGEDIFVESDRAALVERVHRLSAGEIGDEAVQRRLCLARAHSWSGRGDMIRTTVSDLIASTQ